VPRYSTTIDVAAPPERVWDVLADVEHWPEWTPSVERITLLESRPLGVGSRARVEQPKLRPAVLEITRCEPGRGFTWGSRSATLLFVGDHAIDPTPTGCRVTLSVRFGGLFGWLAGMVAGGLTRRYISLEANGLKQRSERPA
jgi:uncharacterized protein YndB with AHSA1/START domain